MIAKIKCKNEAEWRAMRRERIGGSDAGAIVGMNPWKSAYSLWAEKTGVIQPEDISGKEAVRLGNYLEDYVAKRFEEETGEQVRRCNYTMVNDLYPWAHANIDRALIGKPEGLECKTTSEINLKKIKGQEFPEQYYAQCVHYLAVTGWDRWHLAVLVGNRGFYTFTLERDDDEINALMEAERAFWGLVERGTPPEVDGSDSTTETLNLQYTGGDDAAKCLYGMEADVEALRRFQGQKKEIDNQISEIQNRLKSVMGDADRAFCQNASISWKNQSRRSLDAKKAFAAFPGLNDDKFWKTTNSRVFRLMDRKEM